MNPDVPVTDSGGGHARFGPDQRARLRLDIAYDGTDFTGWAVQEAHRTVAGVLDETLSTVFRTPVRVFAAGRTDTGVHATGQVAHVDVPADALPHAYPRQARDGDEEFSALVRRLAKFLPDDVRVRRIARAAAGFDARFSALRRHYAYRLALAPYGAEPQQARFVTPWLRPLNVEAMGEAGGHLLGLHDFRGVLPAPAGRHHHPRSATAGVGPGRGCADRLRQRRCVLLVDGALTGRRAAGSGRGET